MELLKNSYKMAILFVGLSIFAAVQHAGETPTIGSEKENKETLSTGPTEPEDKGAFIYFKEVPRGKDHAYTIMSAPTTLEDKEWKSLFAKGKLSQKDQKDIAEKIKSFVEALKKTSKYEDMEGGEIDLFHFLASCAARAIKPFELDVIPTSNKKGGMPQNLRITYTSPCHCCWMGRYHLDHRSGDCVEVQCFTTSDIQASLSIRGIRVQKCSREISVAPTLNKNLTEMSEKMATITILERMWELCHEMAHVARLDNLERLENYKSNPSHIPQEIQADLIALLILQNEQCFLGAIHFFAKEFIRSFTEQVDYLLTLYPDDHDDMLEEIVTFHKEAEDLAKLPQSIRRKIIAAKKGLYQQAPSDTHPTRFKRMQQILTIWAAYLMHGQEERFTQKEAIDHVEEFCINLFNQYGITNETIKTLLYKIVSEWRLKHLPVQSL